MTSTASGTLMPELASREAYIEYFTDEASGALVSGSKLERTYIKSHILETVRNHGGAPNAAMSFAAATEHRAVQIDDGTFTIGLDDGIVGLMEGVDTRFPVLHSLQLSDKLDGLVNRAVRHSAWLDRVWLSAGFFDGLWEWTKATAHPHRLAKLKIDFEGKFEEPTAHDDIEDAAEDEYATEVVETRRSTFEIADRVGELDKVLTNLRDVHSPAFSTVRLNIPSADRGGHAVWHNGKVTNASTSFAEHLKVVRHVTSTYSTMTKALEDRVWYGESEEYGGLAGQPVMLQFGARLPRETFHTWAEKTFNNKRNAFRLGGRPMWSGSDRSRLHVYGIDRHVWQPITLEATRDHLLVVLPRGTCGNTVNRLITNVQRQLSPDVRAWVGGDVYDNRARGTSAA